MLFGWRSKRKTTMKTQLATGIAAASLALALAAPASRTFTGTITDDMCGKSGHASMNLGNDAKCVVECVKSMHAKYALYDGNEVYLLSDQKAGEKFAAKKVTVTGTLDSGSKTIKVEKVELAK
jgi:hypothetical protein